MLSLPLFQDSLRLVEGYNFQEDCCLVRNMTTQGRTFLVLLCLLCCASVGKAEYLKYKDHKQPVGVRIKDLMKRMNLKEKIGQMTQIERLVASPQVMKDNFIGSVLSGGGSVPAPQATAQDWVNMNNEFQKGALLTRLGIPMIYGIDAVHGHNNVFNATIFPHNVGLGATRHVYDGLCLGENLVTQIARLIHDFVS